MQQSAYSEHRCICTHLKTMHFKHPFLKCIQNFLKKIKKSIPIFHAYISQVLEIKVREKNYYYFSSTKKKLNMTRHNFIFLHGRNFWRTNRTSKYRYTTYLFCLNVQKKKLSTGALVRVFTCLSHEEVTLSLTSQTVLHKFSTKTFIFGFLISFWRECCFDSELKCSCQIKKIFVLVININKFSIYMSNFVLK